MTDTSIAIDEQERIEPKHGRLGNGLSVIVPCFNEAATVETILRSLRQSLPASQIIVVDDGSTDSSNSVVQSIADDLDLRSIQRKQNGGKGSAVRDGLAEATGALVSIQDADLEYSPSDLASLHQAAIEHRANGVDDLVIYGSRYLNSGKAPSGHLAAYLATRLLALVQWLLFGRWLSDPLTCYKLFPTALLRDMALTSSGFELCAEMNAKLFGRAASIVELPISYAPRSFDEGKKIGAKDFFRLIAKLLAIRFTAVKTDGDLPIAGAAYIVSRLAIGALLMFAGLAKVTAGGSMSVASQWVVPEGVVAAWGVVECVLGWLVLSFISHRPLRLLLIAMFTAFVGVLLVEWSRGATQCQCLGGTGLPILAMVGLDLGIVICLIAFRRSWDRPTRLPGGIVGDVAFHGRFVIPALLAAAVCYFGSPSSAIDYLAGRSVLVRSQQQFAGAVLPDEKATTVFELQNASDVPIRVLGAKASCRCVAIDDLPLTIGPQQARSIRVHLIAGHVPGLQRESAELLFDDSTPNLTLGVTALVHPNP
jgi:dolichol-phosphate mannosyltransferase